jgi:hypothetical protein
MRSGGVRLIMRCGATGTRLASPGGKAVTAMSHQWSAPGGFFADADFDYEARIMLGAAASGVGDVGLVLAARTRILDWLADRLPADARN